MMSKSSITIEKVNLPAIHPGEVLADEVAEAGLSVSALARALDVPQSRMADIIAGKRGITADTALRLAAYFGTSARLWLNLQSAYDLAVTEAKDGGHIAAVVRSRAA
ncbi:transcriptional regulator [Elstera cyanobacteriorum]|uniref:Addiction module antidote protein, HigA family n=1 Tax=Elstera cyanobacteriorum TaxID=2022747 RepID=A0A255XUK8_9PROT|nr:HigA family addiction module antitoxin [Elstera cyanobacteriorum]OYQ20613.1 addiction module antidote protein, HigA family [Elstera cyanobacteriorum]GFZ99747.1 transcriptional regulator [Elstera cyanobacteriorum]